MKNSDIEFLFDLVKNKKIRLVNNSILQKEWDNCKKSQKEKIPKSIHSKIRGTKDIQEMYNFSIPNIEPEFSWLDDQISMLDQLLSDHALFVNISDKAKSVSADQLLNRKAPFHNKKDSLKDAYLIFSTLEYFKTTQEKIIFISDNHTDFSDENPNVQKIHPDIIEQYENVNLEYFHNTGLGISELKRKFPDYVLDKSGQVELTSKPFQIDKNVPYERNLYNLIVYSFTNLSYIPLHIFIANEVITEADDKYSYYENFSLQTKNQQFLDTIAKLKQQYLKKTGTRELSSKEIEDIINVLRRNSIYYVSDGSLNNQIDLPKIERNCSCVSCCIKRFDYLQAFSIIDDLKEDSLENISFKAYNLFQLGKVKESFKLFKSLVKKSKETGNRVFLTIGKYNLNKLSKSIPFYLSEENKVQYDLIKEHNSIENNIEDETIKWLIADDFLIDAQFHLNDLKSKLISIFELINKGGTARNYYIKSVYNKFTQFIQFLSLNNIIYDNFLEDSLIKKDFVECLVCAIGIGKKYSGLDRLNYFDIQAIIEYAEYQDLLRSLRRYDIKSFPFKSENKNSLLKLKELYTILFSHQEELFETVNREENTYLIKTKLNRQYSNSLILLAYFEIKKGDFNQFFEIILKCISKTNLVDKQSIRYLTTVISKKESLISKSNTHKLFKSILRYPQLHEREIIATSFKLFAERPENIKVSRIDFKKLKAQFFGQCELCSRGHDEMDIINLWYFAEDYRTEISELILKDIESNNNTELEYLALAIPEEIIPFNHYVIKKLIADTIQFSKSRPNEFFGVPRRSNFYFLQLMHLVYKFKISTNTKEFNKLKGLGDYYVWLLKPEKFDYSNFKVEWLFDIEIHEILDCLKEIKILKEILSRELEENPNHKQLLHSFVRLYKDRKEQLN